MTYLITFSTYGSHLHGGSRGSVDRQHITPGTAACAIKPSRERFEREAMKHPPYVLDCEKRAMTLRAIINVCQHRAWSLYAAHVRADHVHVVVQADAESGKILGDLKAYASRLLNQSGTAPRWTRNGSVRRLTTMEAREQAVHYVAAKQGEPMALFVMG